MILYVIVLAVAAIAPWCLRIEHAGFHWAATISGSKRGLIVAAVTTLALALGVGFVTLGTLATGAFLSQDGSAALQTMLPVWLPILVISTILANRHVFAVQN